MRLKPCTVKTHLKNNSSSRRWHWPIWKLHNLHDNYFRNFRINQSEIKRRPTWPSGKIVVPQPIGRLPGKTRARSWFMLPYNEITTNEVGANQFRSKWIHENLTNIEKSQPYWKTRRWRSWRCRFEPERTRGADVRYIKQSFYLVLDDMLT